MDASFGRALNQVQDIRLLADYSDEPPPLDRARWAVEQAEVFVAAEQEKRPGFGRCLADQQRWPNAFFAGLGLFASATALAQARRSR